MNKIFVVIFALSQMALAASAQSLTWQNGYIDRKGQFYRAEWKTFIADDGSQFVVDMKSITRTANGVRVVAYVPSGD